MPKQSKQSKQQQQHQQQLKRRICSRPADRQANVHSSSSAKHGAAGRPSCKKADRRGKLSDAAKLHVAAHANVAADDGRRRRLKRCTVCCSLSLAQTQTQANPPVHTVRCLRAQCFNASVLQYLSRAARSARLRRRLDFFNAVRQRANCSSSVRKPAYPLSRATDYTDCLALALHCTAHSAVQRNTLADLTACQTQATAIAIAIISATPCVQRRNGLCLCNTTQYTVVSASARRPAVACRRFNSTLALQVGKVDEATSMSLCAVGNVCKSCAD